MLSLTLSKSKAFSPSFRTLCRSFSITETVTKFATDKMGESREKKFSQMVELMTTTPKWTLRSWKMTIDDQMNSWMMYIPGMKNSNEMKDIKGYKEILDAVPNIELDNPQLIDLKAKERIARTAGKPLDDVLKVLSMFNQSRVMYEWLQMKKKANETLPLTQPELEALQQNDIRIRPIAVKILGQPGKKKPSRSPF